MKEVPKVWGKEIWVANEPEYCGKLLHIRQGACSSLHYHKVKKETFYCLSGAVMLEVGEAMLTLSPDTEPIIILPTVAHSFEGLIDSILLEVSTHHDDEDVVRLRESKC